MSIEIRMPLSRTVRCLALGLILVCTAGCDQLTKHLARAELGGKPPMLCPGRFLELTLAENPGAFLSLGATLPPVARNAFSVALGVGLAVLLAYLLRVPHLRWLPFLGLALLWAGGISNLIDRFTRHGLVTDFAVMRIGPLHTGVFNLADFVMVLGLLLLLAASRTSGKFSPSSQPT